MVKRRSIRNNRKGVSSLLVAVYVALIAIALISVLFIGVQTQSTSVLAASKNQQARMQEDLLLQGPNGMQLVGSGSSIVGALRVNNTGTVMIKIRALYIGEVFVCDPSTYQDTYIPPKESKWISLISNQYSTVTTNNTMLDAQWKVTTERGVSTTEKGEYILFGRPGDNDSPFRHGLKTGPLLILFDYFNWRSGTSSWEAGWAIPKGTPDVTWRIYVYNIDTKTITFDETSFFDLVANTNNQGQDQKWFIDSTANQQKILEPKKGMFVEFNAKVNGQPQAITLNPGVSCLNFLAITGTFSDDSAFGQTIPFEAVLITNTPSMSLSATPQTIPIGSAQSTITATMTDGSGNPIPNQIVSFNTNLGLLSAPVAATDNNGIATVKLTAGQNTGTATITATAMGITSSATVSITGSGPTPPPTPTTNPTPTPTPVPTSTSNPTPTPTTSPVTITFQVSGLPATVPSSTVVLTIDSVQYTFATLPKTFSWVPGTTHTVSAASTITTSSNQQYNWISWSDGGAISHTYITPGASATITATYKK